MQSLRFTELWDIVDRYSLTFDDDVPESFKCILCKSILRNAKQIPCGCRFCAECLDTYIADGVSFCPGDSDECRQQIFNDEIVSQDDNYANKEIGKLVMKCVSAGCNFRDCFRKMCEHVSICSLYLEECTLCKEHIQRNEIEAHLENNCPETVINCDYCNIAVTRKVMETVHYNFENESLCELFESVCPYGCDADETVVVKQHLRVCVNKPLCCPYRELGCSSDEIPRNIMEDHLCHEGYRHATVLLETISNLKNEVNRMETAVNTGNVRIVTLEAEVDRLRRENSDMESARNQRNVTDGASASNNDDLRTMIMNLSRRLDLFDIKYEKRYFEYVWRITNFKLAQTQSKKDWNKCIYSEEFFTSKNGYKMQMVLYANGFGDSRGRGLSLFYQIRVGKFDDILEWPFRRNVEMRILDQGGSNDYVVNMFYDPTDEVMTQNYQRPPISNETPLFGCPTFVTKQTLNQRPLLRKNDTIFIQFCATPVNMID